MLDDVVAALRGGGVDDVRILAGDAAAAAAAHDRGLPAVPDPAEGGLRAAVDAGLAAVGDAGVRLVVAADLPGLDAAVVADLLATADAVTVLPTPDGGTAVLVLPAGVTPPARYGPDSAALHVAATRDLGAAAVLLAPSAAGRDLDGPDDLEAARDAGVGPATAATLADDGPHDAPRRRT
jgi:2-phospho-L-lactate guanylyltransferase